MRRRKPVPIKPETSEPAVKRGRGRPFHVPTPETRAKVEALAGFGAPEVYIYGEIGISQNTLRKHYREEMDKGVTKANMQVVQSLFKKAIGNDQGSVAAAIFWAKTRLGWKETSAHEHAGPNGGAIPVIQTIERRVVQPKDAAKP